jgi:hypothetical protein
MKAVRPIVAIILVVLVVGLGTACAGATGEQGLQGIQGIQGVKGDTGEPGPNMVVSIGRVGADGDIYVGYNVTSCMMSRSIEALFALLPNRDHPDLLQTT